MKMRDICGARSAATQTKLWFLGGFTIHMYLAESQ